MMRAVWLAFLVAAFGFPSAAAHELRPAYLEIRESLNSTYTVSWRAPIIYGRPLPVEVIFPRDCEPAGDDTIVSAEQILVKSFTIKCRDSLEGRLIRLSGLEKTLTDVIARIIVLSGNSKTFRVIPEDPVLVFMLEAPDRANAFTHTYFLLGIEHIVYGFDHLLFVLLLVLLVRQQRTLIVTISAFTIAHSITLAVTALGWVSVPIGPVEAVIALSIVFLARELLTIEQRGAKSSGSRLCAVAFAFGLLHGFGFASALNEIGLPTGSVALALLKFNLGVEIGQLAFVAIMLAVLNVADLAKARTALMRTSGYFVGSLSTSWLIARIFY